VTWLDRWWEEASPRRRIDLNYGNFGMLLGISLPAMSIILNGPVPSSNLMHMPITTQIAMCVCIFVGCLMKLHGALSGHRYWFPRTTLKRSYTYGFAGAPIAFVGCVTYSWFILGSVENFWSALSSIGILFFGSGILMQAGLYLLEYRRIDRNERVIRQAVIDEQES
jgi:hypothetical protein